MDNLLSNGAYMLMTSLAWNLKAWLALWLPVENGRWREQHQQQKQSLLNCEFRTSWLASIAEGAGKPDIGELIEDGPYPAEEAKAKGLVNEVGYVEDAREDAKKLSGASYVAMRFGSSEKAPPVSGGSNAG